jgi:hypothetical protein
VGGTIDLDIAPFPMLEFFQNNGKDARPQSSFSADFSSIVSDMSTQKPALLRQAVDECAEQCTGQIKVSDMNSYLGRC